MAMARQPGRPSSPPFALIIMVLLFLVATVAAVMLYVQMGKAQQEATQARADKDAAVAAAKKAEADRLNVMEKLAAGARDLGRASDGTTKLLEEVRARLAAIHRNLDVATLEDNNYGNNLVLDAIDQLAINRKNLYDRNKQIDEELKTQVLANGDLKTQLSAMRDKINAVEADETKKRAAVSAKYEKDIADAQQAIKTLTQQKAALEQEKINEQIKFAQELGEKDMTILRLTNELKKLQVELRKSRRVEVDPQVTAKLPDGAVIQVYPDMNRVYLRLRRPEQAKLGMRYVVVGKGRDAPSSGEGKAVVQIASLERGTVQAEIVKSSAGDPILPGDSVLNLVTGPTQFNFVVAGYFDMNNDQVVEANGKAQIDALIAKWGGNVQQDIDIMTNFVVLGLAPVVPPQPGDDAEAIVREDYIKKKAENEKWTLLHDRAIAYTIPILNEETFLHWIGYYNDDTGPGFRDRVRPGESYFGP